MDKEQIIIDGIDVSECEYVCNTAFGNIGCKLPFNEEIHCCNISNCYYKQLARKTQECEELKSQVDEDYNYYTTELKTLRDIISNKEKRNAALFLTCGYYRKALEEIEEYCNNVLSFTATRTTESDILDIINKVKKGEE